MTLISSEKIFRYYDFPNLAILNVTHVPTQVHIFGIKTLVLLQITSRCKLLNVFSSIASHTQSLK